MTQAGQEDPISILEQVFGLTTDDAEDLLQLTFAVDQSIAIFRYGYPKDNLIPPPMHERLADLDYLRQLLAEAEDDAGCEFSGISENVVQAIRARIESSGNESSGNA